MTIWIIQEVFSLEHRSIRRVLSLFCAALLLSPVYSAVTDRYEDDEIHQLYLNETEEIADNISYAEYINDYSDSKSGSEKIIISAADFSFSSYKAEGFDEYEGNTDGSVFLGEAITYDYSFTVRYSGLYNLNFMYYPVEGDESPIKLRLEIDGSLPFEECGELVFDRIWNDETDEKIYDT